MDQGRGFGTGTTVEWEIIHGNNPLLVNETLAKRMQAHLTAVGGVSYDKDEAAFAKRIFASFDNPEGALGDEMTVKPYEKSLGYGSTDVGDVSWKLEIAPLNWGFEKNYDEAQLQTYDTMLLRIVNAPPVSPGMTGREAVFRLKRALQ